MHAILEETARKYPDNTATIFLNGKLTYSFVDGAANRLANALVGLGVKKGDRVAIYTANCPQYVIAYFATLKLGAIVVPVNPLSRVQTSHTVSGLVCPASDRSVQPLASVVVVSPLITAAMVTFPVSAFWLSAGAGVVVAASFACEPDERIAEDPVRVIPVISTTAICPALLEPLVQVTTKEVSVEPRSASRTNTAELFAEVPHRAVPMRVHVPRPSAWSSDIVGVVVVLAESETNATSSEPETAVVTVTVRFDVPDDPPPAVILA